MTLIVTLEISSTSASWGQKIKYGMTLTMLWAIKTMALSVSGSGKVTGHRLERRDPRQSAEATCH